MTSSRAMAMACAAAIAAGCGAFDAADSSTGDGGATSGGPGPGPDAGGSTASSSGASSSGGSSSGSVPAPWYVFVTGSKFQGNFGGTSAADGECATLAANAGFAGEYKAWISAADDTAVSRVSENGGPWDLVGGARVFEKKSDLAVGPKVPIVKEASKTTVLPDDDAGTAIVAWTGTLANGNTGQHCFGWKNNGQALGDAVDLASSGKWSIRVPAPRCSALARFVCLRAR